MEIEFIVYFVSMKFNILVKKLGRNIFCYVLIYLNCTNLYSQTISAGVYHSIFVCADGKAQSCGNNLNARLGDLSGRNQSSPVDVFGLTKIISTSAYEHSLFLSTDGHVWACGNNSNGNVD